MPRIYDDTQLRSLLRIKRAQTLLLVALGIAAGFWLAQPDQGVAIANPVVSLSATPALTARWCDDNASQGLRFDCTLDRR